MLAAVELAILVDSVVWYAETGAFCTLRADDGNTFEITLMCHWYIFFVSHYYYVAVRMHGIG